MSGAADPTASRARVDDLLDAYLRAIEAGETPDREALLARHPEHREELALALDGMDFVHRAVQAGGLGPARGRGDGIEGAVLGDYRVVREIGRGGMAVVYEAEQLSLARTVALKVLPFAAVLDETQVRRFKHEALAAAHLKHPHIVPVLASGSDRGVHWYAMQYVEGQSLARAIRDLKSGRPGDGPRTPITSHGSHREPTFVRAALRIGRQAAEALDHAHELGVVHRDVKPGNLLVDGAGDVWITDFGLARSQRDAALTMTGELLGTVRYMSPEQALAKRAPVDHRTDVWSLGATLYEVLTLEPAFPGDDLHLVLRDIETKDPVPPRRLNPAIPRDVETVVLKAMSKDPASRYPTARAMAEDLGRCLADEPVRARRPSLAARGGRWARRHRGLVAAALGLMLVTIGALLVDAHRVAREQGRTEAALDAARANLRVARQAVEKYLAQAGIADLEDRPLPPPARRVLLEAALRFYEGDAESRDNAGRRVSVLHALHRYEEAIALHDRVLARSPDDYGALVGRAHMRWHLGRRAAALEDVDRALAVRPLGVDAWHFRGLILEGTEAALAIHTHAGILAPWDGRHQAMRGSALDALNRPREAEEAFTRATALSPNLPFAWEGRGVARQNQGRHAEAVRDFDRALELDTEYADAHSWRGVSLAELGRFDDARRAHQRAIELAPTMPQAWAHLGSLLRMTGDLDGALAVHRAAVALGPTRADVHTLLGVTHLARNEFADAVRVLRVAASLAPGHAAAHFNLGSALQQQFRTEEAIAEYRRAIECRPDLAVAHVNLGNALAETGHLDGAWASWNRAIEVDRDCLEAWGALANGFRRTGQYDRAVAAQGERVRLRPDDADERWRLGGLLAAKGSHRDAVRSLLEALRIDEHHVDARIALGRSWQALGALDRAVEEFRRAVDDDPGSSEAWNAMGIAWMDQGRIPQAIEAYKAALEIRPDYPEARSNLGRALNDGGDPDGGIRECLAALASKDLPEAHLNLANALSMKERHEESLAEYLAAVRLRPTWDIALCGLAGAYADLDRPLDAERVYRDAIRCRLGCGPAWNNLGNLLYRERRDGEAAHAFLTALVVEPAMPEARYGLGRLLYATGRYAPAVAAFREARALARNPVLVERYGRWLGMAERRSRLEQILDPLVSGAMRTRDAGERTELALVLHAKGRFAEALASYEAALAESPALGEDLEGAHRYNAACTALRVAEAGGPDRAALRRRALAWLRADLVARRGAAPRTVATLRDWQRDPDLAAVRDRLHELPAEERDAWTRLWADVAASLDSPRAGG